MESANNISRTTFFSSIRTRIIAGVGAILLLSLIIIVISYLTIETVENGMEDMLENEGVIRDLSVEVENNYLVARQSEADFLNNWQVTSVDAAKSLYVSENTKQLAAARNQLEQLIALANRVDIESQATIIENAESLLPLLNQYEDAFLTTVDQIDQRSRVGGLESALENKIEQLSSNIQPLNNDTLSQILVDLQLNLQKYVRTTQQQYIDNNRLLLNRFRTELTTSGLGETTTSPLQVALTAYNDQFNQLVTLDQNIAINTTIFREITADIEGSVAIISFEGSKEFDAAHDVLFARLRQTILLLRVLTIGTPLLGILVMGLLIRRVMLPLTKLTSAAEAIGKGEFNHKIEVKNKDEFLFLGATFNRMAEQLNRLIGGLEDRVAERTRALETSAQISQKLTTILDENQLVAAVVDEIQRAFDYYHVQIYDFDVRANRLNIVGGTGNAGNSLVATGHYLPQGKGVVGKAAETRQPVLVPDVYADQDWISNPLLPETKAEIAVPIVAGEQLLGVLDVQSETPFGLSEEDVNLLVTIAGQVSVALNNARSYTNIQQKAQFEERVSSIGQKIQAATSVNAVLQIAARELGEALQAKSTLVQLSNPVLPTDNSS
jgi:putative methionine-R-sulfoxide reductase with GAF domain